MSSLLVYKNRPLFGLDIGFSSVKVMQVSGDKNREVVGYGVASFNPAAILNGVIVDPENLAKSVYDLFDKNIIGEITTRRAAVAVPSSRTFARTVKLPNMHKKDVIDALLAEAEQYIPVPIDELYMDYSLISKSETEMELLSIAVPKKIIDSYMVLGKLLGLEIITMETTINAATRLFIQAEQSDVPTVLIDFGSISSDITIYDKALIVTGTVPGGGDSFTHLISEKLGVSMQEAHVIKTKYGLGVSKKQAEIIESLNPILEQLLKEIRRMIRYYEERSGTQAKINQIVTMGGGANMPGLSEHITNLLRLPTRMCDPWQHLEFGHLQPPNSIEKSMYVTVAGLSLLDPKEIFA